MKPKAWSGTDSGDGKHRPSAPSAGGAFSDSMETVKQMNAVSVACFVDGSGQLREAACQCLLECPASRKGSSRSTRRAWWERDSHGRCLPETGSNLRELVKRVQ